MEHSYSREPRSAVVLISYQSRQPMHRVQGKLLIVVIVKANTTTTWNELLGKHCGLTSDHNATFAECQGDSLRPTCGGSRRHFSTSAEFRRIIRSWDFEGV